MSVVTPWMHQVMGTEKSTWREPFSDTSVYMDPGDLG